MKHYISWHSLKEFFLFYSLLAMASAIIPMPAHAQNLMTNPNFEQNLTGWMLAHGSSYVFTDPTISGANVLRTTGATWATAMNDVSAVVHAGQTYTLTFQGRYSKSNVNGYVDVQFIDKNWNTISDPLVSLNSTNLSSYKMQFTVPPLTTRVHISASKNSVSALTSDYADFTNFDLELNPVVPPLAAAVGYNSNTFSTNSFSTTNVDMKVTGNSGYQWYFYNFYGSKPTSANIAFNSDGSVTVGQGGNSYNANLSSATGISKSPGFVGTAFGGGAYIEAVIKFNAQPFNGYGSGWPSFWACALEGNMQTSQWPGQAAGYHHYIEADIFEFFEGLWWTPLNYYQASLDDWYGVNSAQEVYADSPMTVPQANFSQYNTVAMLWVPATATQKGYVNYYWNGALVQSQSYVKLTNANQPNMTNATPWAFAVIDQDHLVLEAGSNNTYPLTIKSVNVWQLNANGNLHN